MSRSDRELLQSALDVLQDIGEESLMMEIRDRLAEPEDDPVAFIADSPTLGNGPRIFFTKPVAQCYAEDVTPLYRHPPRQPARLSEGEIRDVFLSSGFTIKDGHADDDAKRMMVRMENLRSAVERDDKREAVGFDEWIARNSGRFVSPPEVWTAAQQEDRKRVTEIIKKNHGRIYRILDGALRRTLDEINNPHGRIYRILGGALRRTLDEINNPTEE